MKLLPALPCGLSLRSCERYLDQPRPELRRFQLAGKIADSFDQYLAFRPRMILDWERGTEKALAGHPLAGADPLRARFASAGTGGGIPRRLAPRRRAIAGTRFGFWHLDVAAVLHQFFQELAQAIEVHFFVMRPTPEWWSDIRSEREEMRARRKAPATAQLDLQFERGNPLLASFGKTRPRISREHDRIESNAGTRPVGGAA